MNALITGSSSGLGEGFAYSLAEKGYNLILVSRSKDKLNEIKEKIENSHNVLVTILPLDLTIESDINKLLLFFKTKKVHIFINNAGIGYLDQFLEYDYDIDLNMIDLNIKATTKLLKFFLIKMKDTDNAHILNVSSLSAHMPGPKMAVYYATKSYLFNLSYAIRREAVMYKYKVNISTLCPGVVKTNFQKRANMNIKLKPMKKEKVINQSINKMFKRKGIIIPGYKNKIRYYLSKYLSKNMVTNIVFSLQTKKVKL